MKLDLSWTSKSCMDYVVSNCRYIPPISGQKMGSIQIQLYWRKGDGTECRSWTAIKLATLSKFKSPDMAAEHTRLMEFLDAIGAGNCPETPNQELLAQALHDHILSNTIYVKTILERNHKLRWRPGCPDTVMEGFPRTFTAEADAAYAKCLKLSHSKKEVERGQQGT